MASLICISRSFSVNLLRNSAYNVLGGRSIVRSLIHHEGRRSSNPHPSSINLVNKVKSPQAIPATCSYPQVHITRSSSSFFNRVNSDKLWKGVTTVSNAGKKKGRGRGMGVRKSKNLNMGQVIGRGREQMQWPGLTSPIIRGKELVQQGKLPKDEQQDGEALKKMPFKTAFRVFERDPLERGWSGRKMAGISLGKPDPIFEETFEGFNTKVLEFKSTNNMTSIFGRKRQWSLFVITGNGNGLGGFALAKSFGKVYMLQKKATNRAAQKLIAFERYNNHTIMHDFYSQFGGTKIFAQKKPEGYGLVCHRALKSICEVIGIKDLHAKVEGSTKNMQNLTKAFFIGLINQKSHQEIADEKQLHLVEYRGETLNFPKLLASPSSGKVRTRDSIPRDEEMDFNLYIMGGKLPLPPKKFPPGYASLHGWEIHRKKKNSMRNHEKTRRQLLVEYGEVRSFHADQYPECRATKASVQEDADIDAESAE